MSWATFLARFARTSETQQLLIQHALLEEQNRILRSHIDPAKLAEFDRLVKAQYNRDYGLPENAPLPQSLQGYAKKKQRRKDKKRR